MEKILEEEVRRHAVQVKAAEQRWCDLTIIGSRGLRGLSRMILGEGGHDVALNAPMPVVVAT